MESNHHWLVQFYLDNWEWFWKMLLGGGSLLGLLRWLWNRLKAQNEVTPDPGNIAFANELSVEELLGQLAPSAGKRNKLLAGLRRYLEAQRDKNKRFPWPLIWRKAREDQSLTIEHVYIALDAVMVPVDSEVALRGVIEAARNGKRAPAQKALDENQLLVLLGDPGAGKSTQFKYLTFIMADACLDGVDWLRRLHEDERPWQHGLLLPVRVELRDFAAWLPDTSNIDDGDAAKASLLLDFLASDLIPEDMPIRFWARWLRPYRSRKEKKSAESTGVPVEFWPMLRHLLVEQERKPCLILLDGLDEVPAERRQFVARVIEAFARQYPCHRYVATCRIAVYASEEFRDENCQLSGFPAAALLPFSPDQIHKFITDCYVAWRDKMVRFPPMEANKRADNLRRAIESDRALPEEQRKLSPLAERPLLMTIIILLHAENPNGQLPVDLVTLYQEAVNLLLDFWETRREIGGDVTLSRYLNMPGFKIGDLQPVFCAVAFAMHEKNTEEIDKGRLERRLRDLYFGRRPGCADKALQCLHYIHGRAGLLQDHKDEHYKFPHRSFQEFLAARHLTTLNDFPAKSAELLTGDFTQWRYAYTFAVAYAAKYGRIDAAVEAIQRLYDRCHDEDIGGKGTRDNFAVFAGKRMLDIGWQEIKQRPKSLTLLQNVCGWLAETLANDKQDDPERWKEAADCLMALLAAEELPIKERMAVFDSLNKFGDPRFDAGNFFLPKDENFGFIEIPGGEFMMGDADWSDTTPHRVKLSSYWIGKYPVTVAQFRAFIEAKYGGEWNEDWRKYNTVDNHPVVVVSWDEANEYCQWLTGVLREKAPKLPAGWVEKLLSKTERWQIALPTEAQWELAARGKEGRKWPWGEADIRPDWANYRDTQIGAPSPVGCFPGGNTPEGITDMAGNVWEWCSDWYSKEYYAECKARGIVTNPTGPDQGGSRASRGGGWRNSGWACRPALRLVWRRPDGRSVDIGFRLAFSQVFSQAR